MKDKKQLPLEQKEKAVHGERIFPLKKYLTTLQERYPIVTPHWHEEAEFTLITSGVCTYQVDLESFQAMPGDFVFIPPLALHSIAILPAGHMHSETYVFHLDFLGASSADICAMRYLMPLAKQQLIPPFHIAKEHPVYPDALALFYEISSCYSAAQPGYELMLKSLLLKLLTLLLPYCNKSSEQPQLQSEHTQKIKGVLEYIGLHYTENISIESLASSCYFSEYHFMRFFKKYVGMSCLDYIKSLRLQKAADLLEQQELSITDAAMTAGFSSLSYFYREFKKRYGMTPRQFIHSLPERQHTNRTSTPGSPFSPL